jgi:hypothetical protein
MLLGAGDLKPKENAQAYRYYSVDGDYSIGVTLLTADQAETRLSTPLSRSFYVVEVAFFPKKDQTARVDWKQFTLKEPDFNRASQPMEAKEVAATVHKFAKKPKRTVSVAPGASVGVASTQPYPTRTGQINDPYGRDTRLGTRVGVGVGIGSEEQPGGKPEDRPVMEQELEDLALTEGIVSKPAAGMLYFPIGRMKANSRKILEYRDPAKPASAPPIVIDLTPILGP